MGATAKAHWENRYRNGSSREFSWFELEPVYSLAMFEELGVRVSDSVIDVGGGASSLADRLIDRGHTDVSALDVSATALAEARGRVGGGVDYLQEDLTSWTPSRQWHVWHDRLFFHFLASPADRSAYLNALDQAVAPGGAAIIATFASDGPERCSGLQVVRYDADQLADTLGHRWDLRVVKRELHETPLHAYQAFTWAGFRRR